MPQRTHHTNKNTAPSTTSKSLPVGLPSPINMSALSAKDVIQLQQMLGNQAVLQMLRDSSAGDSPAMMRKLDPLAKEHVSGSILNRTKTRTINQKIAEYNKTPDDQFDKRLELLLAVRVAAESWIKLHGDKLDEEDREIQGGGDFAQRDKEHAVQMVLDQTILEMADVNKQKAEKLDSGFTHEGVSAGEFGRLEDEDEAAGDEAEQVGGSDVIGGLAGAYSVADPLTANIAGHGVASSISGAASGKGPDPRVAENIVGSFKNLFESLQNPSSDSMAGMKEALGTITGQLAAIAVPGVSFALAVAGYVDARDTKKVLNTSIAGLKDQLGLRTADTETLLLAGGDSESAEVDAEEVPEADVPMLDLSGLEPAQEDAGAAQQELLDSLLYAERKVLRRYIDAIYNIVDTGISLVGSIASLIVPVAGLAKLAIDAGKAALNAIKTLVRKVKGIYKLAAGKRGKRRFQTAEQIVEAAQAEDEVALKLIVALDPGGALWKLERATWGAKKYQAFPSWPDNPKHMLALINLMAKNKDLKTLKQMIADKFKSVA